MRTHAHTVSQSEQSDIHHLFYYSLHSTLYYFLLALIYAYFKKFFTITIKNEM